VRERKGGIAGGEKGSTNKAKRTNKALLELEAEKLRSHRVRRTNCGKEKKGIQRVSKAAKSGGRTKEVRRTRDPY